MDKSSITSEFLDIESTLFSTRPHDIPIWEWMRFHVYQQLLRDHEIIAQETGQLQRGGWSHIKGGFLWMQNALYRNPFFSDPHDCLVYGDPRRIHQEDGYWWDPYTDPVLVDSGIDYLQVESNYQFRHFNPARTENLRYLDFIDYTDYLKRRLSLVDVELPHSVRHNLRMVQEELFDRLDSYIDLVKIAQYYLNLHHSRRPLYERFLSKIEPEVVLIVNSYGNESFIHVCKEMDIPVVELQHGIINEEHMGYSYPGSRTKENFPDYLLTFGEFWSNSVSFPIPAERVIATGYPFLERQQINNITQQNEILFVSQPTIGNELSKFAVEVDRHLSHYDVIYKLHPGEYSSWRQRYPWLENGDFSIIDGSGPSLYDLFARAQAQVGVNSTAIFEGLHFELETYIYNCPGANTMNFLIDEGAAELITTADDLGGLVGQRCHSVDNERFFTSDAKNRTREVIKHILDEGTTIEPENM